MFSVALEMVLSVAFREALSRRHAHLTLEHLLYAIAHDPGGEEILQAVGVGLPRLRARAEAVPRGARSSSCPRARTGARPRRWRSAACCRRPCCTAERGPGRGQRGRRAGRGPPAAEVPGRPAPGGAGGHAARHPQLHLARRDQGARAPTTRRAACRAGDGAEDERAAGRATPLAAYAVNLTERARQGLLDPLIGRDGRDGARARGALPPPQEQPGLRGRGRRRQDRARRGAGAAAAGRGRARAPEGRGDLQPRLGRAAGRAPASAATSRSASRR